MSEPTTLTAAEIARLVSSREISCREVAEAHLALPDELNAFLRRDPEAALREADAVQARLDAGESLPLAGVPYGAKDNLSTTGIETTCASRILEGYVPPFDATAVERARAAGMVLLGKNNLDEFAMGASTETSVYGTSRNPHDLDRTPGGSSGGSAAAVAGGLAPVSLGSDTGGSIRQPAALCGCVGFKPTYGRVSRWGLVAFGSSLDQVGPLTRTVEDAALVAEAISGHDPLDGTSLQHPAISSKGLHDGTLKGLRVAIPRELMGDAIAPGVRERIAEALDLLRKEGAILTDVSIPTIALGVTTYYIIAPAEASSNLARFDGIRFGPRAEGGAGHVGLVEKTRGELFGHEVKARIMIGTYALSAGYYDAYYTRAQQVRGLMQREFDAVFHEHDVVFSPTSPVTAFKSGELDGDPLTMKLLDACTIPANMGGMPGISLPCGMAEGLPVGLQLMAAPLEDEALLRHARSLERALGA